MNKLAERRTAANWKSRIQRLDDATRADMRSQRQVARNLKNTLDRYLALAEEKLIRRSDTLMQFEQPLGCD